MGNYDSIDLDFTWSGDYVVGQDGDLGDTSDDFIRSLVNEVRTVCQSEYGDWERDPAVAADLADFRGEPNTRVTGDKIRDRVKSRIVSTGIVRAEDLFVRVTPVHIHQVLVMIRIQAQATPGNSLVVGEPIQINLIYDSSEHDIFFLPPPAHEREAI